MLKNKALVGAIAGALVAVIWVAFDGTAVLLVAGLAAIGWALGTTTATPAQIQRSSILCPPPGNGLKQRAFSRPES